MLQLQGGNMSTVHFLFLLSGRMLQILQESPQQLGEMQEEYLHFKDPMVLMELIYWEDL